MTRVSKAAFGFLGGLVVAACGVAVVTMWLVAGLVLALVGVVVSGVFLFVYDVDEPQREASQ